MTAREVARRVAIWAVPVAFIAVAAAMLVVRGEVFLLLGWSGFPVVGAIILTARPRNGVGRALLAVGAMWLLAASVYIPLQTFGDALPSDVQALLSIAGSIAGFFAFLLLAVVMLVFPSGRVRTRTGRFVGALVLVLATFVAIGTTLLPVPPEEGLVAGSWAIPALAAWTQPANLVMNLGSVTLAAAAAIELIVRWRRADGIERLQFRWFAFGACVAAAGLVLDTAAQMIWPDLHARFADVSAYSVLLLNAIPASIGMAVTRHGLYEINRILSRAASYALVTAIAVLAYALVVTSVTMLLPDAPSLAVAAATLVAAAVFLPVLRRVQRGLDRRFDRERYDAQKVVDAFGERLRIGADPASTTEDLRVAVQTTLQPASLAVWTVRR